MKFRILTLVLTALLILPLVGCRVEQTEEGSLPDVEVDVEGGNMPKFDVDTAEVKVTEGEAEVSVPDVDVHMEKKTIPVPNIDIEMPDEDPDDAHGEDPEEGGGGGR